MPTLSLRGGHNHPVEVARRHTIGTRPGLGTISLTVFPAVSISRSRLPEIG
ncbi:MAG: hypothetical protein QOJ61_2480, partial [Mycobacterium sp.]|nr:hypothetical protein [Mycobacterium sp.]